MAVKRPKFVKVINSPQPRAGTDIPGIRRQDDVLAIGDVVPVEWFGHISDEQFIWMTDDVKCIEAHTPDTKEMLFLKDAYPTLFAETDKAVSPTKKSTKKGSE